MRWTAAILLAGWVFAAPPSVAQPCVGDCNGDGAVSIADLITAVNISLGSSAVSACVAVDRNLDGLVSISELIAAVGHGLRGCPPPATPTVSSTAGATDTATATPEDSPTPVDSATASATPSTTDTPAATPTATATVIYPDVSGVWDEEQLRLASSDCLEFFAVEFAAELARRPPCTHQVSSVGPIATVVDCNQRAFLGALDAVGRITFALPDEVGEEGGCTVALSATVRVPAAESPTAATYFFQIVFGGTCPLDSCELTATAPWTLRSEF